MTLAVLEPAAPAAEPVLRRVSLVGRTRGGLSEALAAIGVPEKERRMRVGQLWSWIYHYGVRDFSAMTTMAKEPAGGPGGASSRSTGPRSRPRRRRPTARASG